MRLILFLILTLLLIALPVHAQQTQAGGYFQVGGSENYSTGAEYGGGIFGHWAITPAWAMRTEATGIFVTKAADGRLRSFTEASTLEYSPLRLGSKVRLGVLGGYQYSRLSAPDAGWLKQTHYPLAGAAFNYGDSWTVDYVHFFDAQDRSDPLSNHVRGDRIETHVYLPVAKGSKFRWYTRAAYTRARFEIPASFFPNLPNLDHNITGHTFDWRIGFSRVK